jgi:hypothetical protein
MSKETERRVREIVLYSAAPGPGLLRPGRGWRWWAGSAMVEGKNKTTLTALSTTEEKKPPVPTAQVAFCIAGGAVG